MPVIEDLWRGSTLTIYDLADASDTLFRGGNIFAYILLLIIIVSIFTGGRLMRFLGELFSMSVTPHKEHIFVTSFKAALKMFILFAASVPVAAYLIFALGFIKWGYPSILIILSCALAVRIILNKIICTTAGVPLMSRSLNSLVYSTIIFITIISFFGFTLYILIPPEYSMLVKSALIWCVISIEFLYIYGEIRIFFSNKTPLFYSFLYLCTLELLPSLIIYRIL